MKSVISVLVVYFVLLLVSASLGHEKPTEIAGQAGLRMALALSDRGVVEMNALY